MPDPSTPERGISLRRSFFSNNERWSPTAGFDDPSEHSERWGTEREYVAFEVRHAAALLEAIAAGRAWMRLAQTAEYRRFRDAMDALAAVEKAVTDA